MLINFVCELFSCMFVWLTLFVADAIRSMLPKIVHFNKSTHRPDDIHKLYSGRTCEINNTDAEGRLVLADGVAYAQKNLKATIILDMATLTGAQVSAIQIQLLRINTMI